VEAITMSPDTSDHDLLRDFVNTRSQAAFAELVRRHVDLVYSAARRQVRSPQLAEDIAQSVFTDLARNARRISAAQPLAAWLHLVTRRTAVDAIRRESRRQAREQQAAAMEAMPASSGESSADWTAVAPLLDEAVASLDDRDRAAILLRYFENKSLRDVGAALGTSDDAAQKRVSRAVEQLRDFFLRRGVAVTAAGLATDLSAHALQNAPAGLSVTISSAVASGVPAAATALAATLTMTTLEKAIVGAVLAGTLGVSVFEVALLRVRAAEVTAVHERNDDLAAQARVLVQQRAVALRRTDETLRRVAEAKSAPAPLADAAVEAQLSAWLKRAAQLKHLRQQRPELSIPEFQFLNDDDWFAAAREGQLDSEEGIRTKFAELRWDAEKAFVEPLQHALGAYAAAHDGDLPVRVRDLAPLVEPPIEPAALDRYEMLAAGKLADAAAPRNRLVGQNKPADLERDCTWTIGVNGWGSDSALRYWTEKAGEEYAKANGGIRAIDPAQLVRYLPAPVSDPEKLRPYLKPSP
jgi:RNA polymerase sigma factor (sigma-70 family)